MPKRLIDQWITQFELVAPGAFTIYKYHGDARRHEPVAGEKMIQGRLNRQHPMFDGSSANANVIVVSSYSTFTERHGPTMQRKWRINTSRWSRTQADSNIDNLDPKWPDALDNMFGFVVLDEAHIIKHVSNKTSTCITWLSAAFHILITATPIPNGIEDWRGYMPFIQHKDADQWWAEDSLDEMEFEGDENPFDLDDAHPAAKLQMTSQAARDWIFANRIDPATKGLYLSRVWERCMLRRTYSSRVPFEVGPTIGSKLPKVHATLINCTYDEDEQAQYYALADQLTGALLLPGSGVRRVKWSLAIQRKLQLLSTSTLLPNIDEVFNLKAANMKKLFEEAGFFTKWLEDEGEAGFGVEKAVWKLCRGAPKVRALLRNIRSQVSGLAEGFRKYSLPIGYQRSGKSDCFLPASRDSDLSLCDPPFSRTRSRNPPFLPYRCRKGKNH